MSRLSFILLLNIVVMIFSCRTLRTPSEKTRTLEETVVVTRLFTDEYEFFLDNEGPWSMYQANNLNSIFDSDPKIEFTGDSLVLKDDIEKGKRAYFGLVNKGKDSSLLVVSERHIPLEGQINCRDLGGIPTKDGSYTSWGKIFRSGQLSSLSDRDLAYLENLKLKTIVDFRTKKEIDKQPDRIPAGAKHYWSPIADTTGDEYSQLMRQIIFHRINSRNAKEKFREVMEHFADTASADFKPVFDHLLQPDKVPLLFHCAGGKDRTGLMASIVLLALGVDEKTVKEDYLMSNYYRYEFNLEKMKKGRRFFIGNETLESAFIVQEAYIDAVFDVINKKYEGIDNYLLVKFGITPEKRGWLIENYTYKPEMYLHQVMKE